MAISNVDGTDQTKCLQFKGKALQLLQLPIKFTNMCFYIFIGFILFYFTEQISNHEHINELLMS